MLARPPTPASRSQQTPGPNHSRRAGLAQGERGALRRLLTPVAPPTSVGQPRRHTLCWALGQGEGGSGLHPGALSGWLGEGWANK